MRKMTQANERDVDMYLAAKAHLLKSVFAYEIESIAAQQFDAFNEKDILRETAWVILCSGFRESIVRRLFSFISLCFCDWESAAAICNHADKCRSTAIVSFRNTKKLDAIIGVAAILEQKGFSQFKQDVLEAPIPTLQVLPYIGPVTAFHLAKNLGLPTAKPDRHLERLARNMGYAGTQELCCVLATATGDPIQVVDTILWRCAEQRFPLTAKYTVQNGDPN